MSVFLLLIYFCGSFLLCSGLTFLTMKIALHREWVVQPSAERWHKKPTALLGGCAIFITLLFFLSLSPEFVTGQGIPHLLSLRLTLIIGASLLFAMGLYDDFCNAAPSVKLICQILAALLVILPGYRLHWFSADWFDFMVTLLWIVGITNAFNLIDNMDGLCAGTSVIASLCLAVVLFSIVPEAALFAMLISGASAGFLVHNLTPAKIFMGDCGSQVLGFSIAVLAVWYSAEGAESTLVAIIVPLLIVMVPIVDISLVTVTRLLSGRKVYIGGCDHSSHRLVLMGLSEKNAVFCLYGTAAVSALAALLLHFVGLTASLIIAVPLLLFVSIVAVYLSRQKIIY